jgi:hypothetical protein
MINGGVNIQFLRDHLGFGNEKVIIEDKYSNHEYANMPEVKTMPVYPNDGGIKVVDGMIIVKMGE